MPRPKRIHVCFYILLAPCNLNVIRDASAKTIPGSFRTQGRARADQGIDIVRSEGPVMSLRPVGALRHCCEIYFRRHMITKEQGV